MAVVRAGALVVPMTAMAMAVAVTVAIGRDSDCFFRSSGRAGYCGRGSSRGFGYFRGRRGRDHSWPWGRVHGHGCRLFNGCMSVDVGVGIFVVLALVSKKSYLLLLCFHSTLLTPPRAHSYLRHNDHYVLCSSVGREMNRLN